MKKSVLALTAVVAVPVLAAAGYAGLSSGAHASASPRAAAADQDTAAQGCAGLPSAAKLQTLMQEATVAHFPGLSPELRAGPGGIGGLYGGQREWGAVVNRAGQLCAWITNTSNPADAWPGSQAIAKAKAYTANAFSNSENTGPNGNLPKGVPLSTARLYTLSQPGHSLWGLNQSNPFNPQCEIAPASSTKTQQGLGQVCGGIITFGGGVPLYKGTQVIGGLGMSGDTACADHEMAKRVRDLAAQNPPGGPLEDDIQYAKVNGPSVFDHPLCVNTYRNGSFIGTETSGSY